MYQLHYLNPISPKGTALWTDDYTTAASMDDANAILVRSAAMHDLAFSNNLLAIARAGAGAAAQVIMMAVPIAVFVISQSNIIETMGSSGMKD